MVYKLIKFINLKELNQVKCQE